MDAVNRSPAMGRVRWAYFRPHWRRPNVKSLVTDIGAAGSSRIAVSPHPWGGRAPAGSDPVWRP